MSIQLDLPRLSQPLKLWEKIEIVVGDGADSGKYSSRIEDFQGNDLVISAPNFVGGSKRLTDNADVWALIVREDATYRFACNITRIEDHGRVSYILVNPHDVERVQRRMFYRIELFTEVELCRLGPTGVRESLVGSEDNSANENDDTRIGEEWHLTTGLDISGGGILVRVPEGVSVTPGDIVLLSIDFLIEKELPATIAGICRRLAKREDKKCAGIEFIRSDQLNSFVDSTVMNMLPDGVHRFDKKAQNKLVSAIFHKQVEFRNKGVLG